MKKELTEAEVAFIRRALKHFQNWLGSGEEPVLDNSIQEKKQKPSDGRQWVNFGCMK